MNNYSESFQRIESNFKNFCVAIEKCRTVSPSTAAEWQDVIQDAYAWLARLRDRYLKKERHHLPPSVCTALSKVFEDDPFIKGMMQVRQISEHTKLKEPPEVRTIYNAPITLDTECSAMAVFSAPIVSLPEVSGNMYCLDHLSVLEEAEKRIVKAISKAKSFL